jgi:hypothetical protein
MVKQKLSPRQADILAVMVTFRIVRGLWPTIQEIMVSLDPPAKSPVFVHRSVLCLEKKGWLRRPRSGSRDGSRSYELVV